MKKKILLTLMAVFLVSSLSSANTFSLKANYFVPNGPKFATSPDSLWNIEYENMDFRKSAFQGWSFNLSYEYFLTRELSLEFSIDAFYSKNVSGDYWDYLGFEYDSEWWAVPAEYDEYMDLYTFYTGHRLKVSITPVQLSLKIMPFGRRGKFMPYIGAGIGAYFWNVTMQGDMIDFNDEYVYESTTGYDLPVYPIYEVDARESENFAKVTLGYHVMGGIMLALGRNMTLDIGAKYNIAKGRMTEGFEGFDPFDLGGFQFSIGVNYWSLR